MIDVNSLYANDPALWLIYHLYDRASPEHFINIRAIHNKRPYLDTQGKEQKDTEVVLNRNYPLRSFLGIWDKELKSYLISLNTNSLKPANIYFSVNPRISETANKKKDSPYYQAFFLDMDVTSRWSLEQRIAQINFFIYCGYRPSIVIMSGNGFQVYWKLAAPIDIELGQEILKLLVEKTDCKEGGNTHDPTRIFRSPGFLNQKLWYKGKSPAARIWLPEPNNIEVAEYSAECFHDFPWSRKDDLKIYLAAAKKVPWGTEEGLPIEQKIARVAMIENRDTYLKNLGFSLHQRQEKITHLENAPLTEDWEPKNSLCPYINDIIWPRGYSWCKSYAKAGFSGLSQGQIDKIAARYKSNDKSASFFDYHIIRALILADYNFEAIAELWGRTDLRLMREDKMRKNPNYLKMTFDTALAHIKEYKARLIEKRKEQKAKRGDGDYKVVIDNYQTFIASHDEEFKTCIFNGQIELENIYLNKDVIDYTAREWFNVKIKVCDPNNIKGYRTHQRILPGECFNSVAAFKRYTGGNLVVTTDRNSYMQYLKKWMIESHPEAKTLEFYERVVYEDGVFRFPGYIIEKKHITNKQDEELTKFLTDKFAMQEWFPARCLPLSHIKKILKSHWEDLLSIHSPEMVCAIMGIVGASAIRPILEKELKIKSFHIPIINVRGISHTGKTETSQLLFSISGIGPQSGVINSNVTAFAIRKLMAVTNFVPFIIDEFKETGENNAALEIIREHMRQVYSGETFVRGTQHQGLNQMRIHGGYIVVGETALERPGQVAELTRLIPIDTDTFIITKKAADRYHKLKNVPFYELGPYLFQQVLHINPKDVHERYENLFEICSAHLSNSYTNERLRIGHNLAVLVLGCEIIDTALKRIWPEITTITKKLNPLRTLCRHMTYWAEQNDHSYSAYLEEKENEETLEGALNDKPLSIAKRKRIVITKNEWWQFFGDFFRLIETRDRPITEAMAQGVEVLDPPYHDLTDETPFLTISLPSAYKAYEEYCIRYRKFSVPLSKIKKHLELAYQNKEPWIVGHENKKCGRHVTLNFQILLRMGLINAPASTGFPSRDQTIVTSQRPEINNADLLLS